MLKTDGQLVCFGRNVEGQCDVPSDLGPILAVSAGYHHTCVIKTTGQLRCFGSNIQYVQNIKPGQVVNVQKGNLGLCDVPAHLGPTLAVAANFAHTCAVGADGGLVCFGHPNEGKCDVPEDVGPVIAVAAGAHHSCAVKFDGQLLCFGRGNEGQFPQQLSEHTLHF